MEEKYYDMQEDEKPLRVKDKLRTSRIRKGLSLSELSKLTGIKANKLCSYESGKASVPMADKVLLVQALHISLYYLRKRKCQNPYALLNLQDEMIKIYEEKGETGLKEFEKVVH